MMRPIGLLHVGLALALLGFESTSQAWSQQFPSRPVRLIVPFAPGGGTDIVARAIAQQLSGSWPYPVIVDNRPGGGTTIGTGIAATAAPDGHTLVIVASTFAADAALYPKLPYNPSKSFSPITRVTDFPFVLVANPSTPAKSVGELIRYAKANPGKLNYAAGGGSAPARLGMELFKWLARVEIVGIPYKGAGPSVTALLAGETHLLFSTLPGVLPHISSQRLRALAVTTSTRYHAVPDLATIAEAGVPGYEFTSWHGVLAPARTPAPLISRINAEINEIMSREAIKGRLAKLGLDATGSSPQQFAGRINSEVKKWAKLIKEAGIRAN